MSTPSQHSLLQRQLRRVTRADGSIDHAMLIALVDAAYHDHDRATRLADRATNLASEELSTLAQTLREERDVSMQARRDAEAANVAKSRFLANMSHELRTPLNAVIGYTELIAEEASELRNEAISQDCGRVLSAAHHLLSLIQDVLDISKIEAGKLTLRPSFSDLDQMFQDLQSTALPLAAKNGNMLVFECDGSLGRAFLDVVKLRQCALNLLSNACKFTRNGIISVRARRDLSASGDRLRFEVSDTGMGISEEKRRQLFEPFVQAHELTIEGAGLGLAITRRLCDMMGGAVSVESVLGEGSTFTMILPLPALEASVAA